MTAQPMRPEDVPGKVLAEALEAWTGYDDPLNECAADDIETAATILAAVIPAIGEHLATAIEANPSGECSGAVAECARLVRNLTQGDQ